MKCILYPSSIIAGRPVIFLPLNFVEHNKLHVDDRLLIKFRKKRIIVSVDVLSSKRDKMAMVSKEVVDFLSISSKSLVSLESIPEPRSLFAITKKLNGLELSDGEIHTIIRDIVSNSLNEAEIAYFVSGVYQNGMSLKETISLTRAVYKTGISLKWGAKQIADKHSIGGIPGNRTTPIVVSICSAAGLIMPKTSSRAITSASGTADVMETITNVALSPKKMQEVVRKTGACLVWGGAVSLAPADDKLIRVERLLNIDPESQLIASILAKKLSAGSTHVLIDIPAGPGAKVSLEKAEHLKDTFEKVARSFGLKLLVVITDGKEPIGNGVGPILELHDVLRVLKRDNSPIDLERKSVKLAALLLHLAKNISYTEALVTAQTLLDSGAAYEQFKRIISIQGKPAKISRLGKYSKIIFSSKSGVIKKIDNLAVNNLGKVLGCSLDKGAGIYLHKHCSEHILKNEPLLTLYAESKEKLSDGIAYCKESRPISIN